MIALSDCDDLGQPSGSSYFSGATEASHAVQDWEIVSIGRRPRDFMARDLMTASLLRDGRLFRYRKLCDDPPEWMGQMTLHLPSQLRKSACQVIALHYLHQTHLHQLFEQADNHYRPIIHRLQKCWPYGYEVRWDGPGKRTSHDICRMPRQCPFCFARKVIEIFERVADGLRRDANADVLIVGRVSVCDATIDALPRNTPAEQRFRIVKEAIGRRLMQEVQAMGAVGGLMTFSVSPQLDSRWEKTELERNSSAGFRYDLAVVAQVKTPTQRLLDLAEGRQITTGAVLRTDDEAIEPEWEIHSGIDNVALRMALVGSSLRYMWTDRRWGELGVFKVQPWVLANYEQWTGHLEGTRGLRLFDVFGEWRGLGRTVRQVPTPGLANAPARAGKRHRQALKNANKKKHRDANAHFLALLNRLNEVLEGLPNWRRLGRVALREYALDVGITLTDREVRGILKCLRQQSVRSPSSSTQQ